MAFEAAVRSNPLAAGQIRGELCCRRREIGGAKIILPSNPNQLEQGHTARIGEGSPIRRGVASSGINF
jgi:hypothetical protein